MESSKPYIDNLKAKLKAYAGAAKYPKKLLELLVARETESSEAKTHSGALTFVETSAQTLWVTQDGTTLSASAVKRKFDSELHPPLKKRRRPTLIPKSLR